MKEKIFKNYEKKVLKILVSNELSSEKLIDVIENAEFIGYEYTGSGYYLVVRHPNLPKNRIVCHKPIVIGETESIECGFVVFLENNKLTIECHSWNELKIPENFREKNIKLREFNKNQNEY